MFGKNITINEYLRLKALGINGLIQTESNPNDIAEKLTFVNNIDEIQKNMLKEYNIWYDGDGFGLLNYYTRANSIDFNTDPLANRNKKDYFWSVSSTELDTKRTHSGQPRNIVDTLVNIIGTPQNSVEDSNAVLKSVDARLHKILDDNRFDRLLTKRARPLTLVEGWGAWKINWDKNFRDTPIILYYRADSVDFVWRSNQLVAIIYRDYYQDNKKNNYVLFETRRIEMRMVQGSHVPCLIIEKELFKMSGQSDILTPIELKKLPQLKDTAERIIVENYSGFLGAPSIYFDDSEGFVPGRSIFKGKIDLFDDLDQCLSQASNSVRRSTPTEVWDVNYLDRDKDGMPVMPHAFDRKYVSYKGAKGGDGSLNSTPVQITQPQINFEQYSNQAIQILLQIINGIMAPATIGLDIAKKDNGESQREKEKVTIFTRNAIIEEERRTIKMLMNDVLVADELMRTGKVTCNKYSINVKYSKFADASFEATLETVTAGYQAGLMDAEFAIDMLYGDSISKEIRERLIAHLDKKEEEEKQNPYGDDMDPDEAAELGGILGGNHNNPHNKQAEKISPDTVKDKLGVPELGNYEKTHNRKQMSDVNKALLK